MVAAITAATIDKARPNHQMARMPSRPISPDGNLSTLIPIESDTEVIMARVKFWTVTSKLPAEPWYDLGTLEVMKMVAAAKLKSGPRDANATAGMESAQYEVPGCCGRKNTFPMPKKTMLVAKIQWPGRT